MPLPSSLWFFFSPKSLFSLGKTISFCSQNQRFETKKNKTTQPNNNKKQTKQSTNQLQQETNKDEVHYRRYRPRYFDLKCTP